MVIFVHGGGWVGGDKHAPGDDLYENVILWAAKQGMVGVNVNYRLADYTNSAQPLSGSGTGSFSGGRLDRGEHRGYGGDPNRMFLWGHSAGGSAVAGLCVESRVLWERSHREGHLSVVRARRSHAR